MSNVTTTQQKKPPPPAEWSGLKAEQIDHAVLMEHPAYGKRYILQENVGKKKRQGYKVISGYDPTTDVPPAEPKAEPEPQPMAKKRGRPKGSKNRSTSK